MKSVRAKLIASILICSLFTSVLIGVLAISNSARTAGKDAAYRAEKGRRNQFHNSED